MVSKTVDRITIPVGGMHCASCVTKVEGSLSKVAGVESAAVNLASEEATVEFQPGVCTVDDLYRAVETVGYEPKPITRTYAVRGMTCASCVKRVEDALLRVDGVERAQVNLATERVSVALPPAISLEDLQPAVEAAGYELLREVEPDAGIEDADEQERAAAERGLLVRMVFALTAAVALMVLAQSSRIAGLSAVPSGTINVISLLLATPVLFWAGRPFFQGAWQMAKHRSTDMNTL
ncbi:MAG: copper ion binding protein, partial [Chloroflexi bacterium]|nr:copper ion binding protein [Chloroflexota bacterium]